MELRRGAVTVFVLVMCLCSMPEAQLQVGFYESTCPQAEAVVAEELRRGLASNIGLAAGLVRMHFHDCFVRGCDGSVLIDSTSTNKAEKDSPINNPSLRGFEVIDNAKTRLESACKGIVSCADVLAFAARDSVAMTGGMRYQVPGGRRDGRVSLDSEVLTNLPGPTFDVSQLNQSFANKGLNMEEMVTLSGAHSIGRSHCSSFSSRLYSFNATASEDPSLDANYAAQLKQQCPQSSNNSSLVVFMDPRSPYSMDASYYGNLLQNLGLFASDQVLASDSATASQVMQNVAGGGIAWKRKFAAAMAKMGQIGVLTGSDGEIRTNCRVIN
ncbi:peroxidase 5 [Canna indica]|uniref:Peroxidase n=1 Tax=Canna indica TaxID=4628 RepID=A0AAQ3KIT2_9LILI|nr:peroxidase 5 [Canna indica]